MLLLKTQLKNQIKTDSTEPLKYDRTKGDESNDVFCEDFRLITFTGVSKFSRISDFCLFYAGVFALSTFSCLPFVLSTVLLKRMVKVSHILPLTTKPFRWL